MTGKRKGASTSRITIEHREELFALAFIANGGNGAAAAVAAGYAEHSARRQAVKLLERPRVREMIKTHQGKLAEKHELTADSVIAELAKIVHADPRKLFGENGALLPMKDWPDDMAGAVASIEVVEMAGGADADGVKHIAMFTKKVKLWDKNQAIDKAMKHLGLFAEDNKQRAGALSDLPREMVKAIVDRLKQLNSSHGASARLD